MKYICLVFINLLVLATCCSCGNISTDINEISRGAEDTEETIDKTEFYAFKNGESTWKENRFENDYVRIWKDQSSHMWQGNLDGTGQEKIPADGMKVLWLTNDWIYYAMHDTVVRAPVDNKQVPVYDRGREETLFEAKDITTRDFFVTDSYILYRIEYEDDLKTVFYRYDFETKKSSKVFDMEGYSDIIFEPITNMPVTTGNVFFLRDDDANLYRVTFDALDKKEIYSAHYTVMSNHCTGKHAGEVYFIDDETKQIYKYNESSDEVSCVLEKENFQKEFEAMKLWDEDETDAYSTIRSLSVFQDKLYMNLKVSWYVREKVADGPSKGEKVECIHEKDVLISADFDNLDNWGVENRLSDYFSEHAPEVLWWRNASEKSALYIREQLAHIYGMNDGKVYFDICTNASSEILKEEAALDMGLYDITTGETVKLDDNDYRHWYFEHSLGIDWE